MNDVATSLQDLIRLRQAVAFVGREGQLAQFATNLELPVEDLRRCFVFCIHGDGGVGKTFLIRQLQRISAEHGAVGAYIDEAIFSATEAMVEIATQAASQGVVMKDFMHLAENYRQRRSEVEADPHAPTGIASFMTRTAARVGIEALRSVPAVGGLAAIVDGDAIAEQADQLRKFLGAKLRHEDVRMLLSPVEALTPTFVRELTAGSRLHPLALFFDTYERTAPFLDDWLLAILEGRYGQLPAEIIITIAGRDPVDPGRWSPYLSVMADVPLTPFDDTEAHRLLSSKGISDEHVIEVILRLSGGLPLLVAMLAEHQPSDVAAVGDPTGDAIERFLKWENDPARRALAVTAALPRSVNEDVLRELTDGHTDVRKEFAWLRSLSFVTHEAGRCQYHTVVRSAMLRLERGQSPNRWSTSHERLVTHYRNLRVGRSATDAWDDETWRDLRLEEIYHELCIGSPRAVREALAGLIHALDIGTHVAAAWIHAIEQAGEDAESTIVRGWGARLSQAQLDAEGEGIAVLDLLIREADVDTSAKEKAYCIRGRGHRRRKRYDTALADFTSALEIDPKSNRASLGRGETYRLMGQHGDALTDFNRAIELNPEPAWALSRRGETYRLMERYDDALTDFNRAIELRPDSAWTLGSRGQLFHSMERYDEALTDFNRAIELRPDSAWTLGSRGQLFHSMERYDEALTDFNRAIELNSDSVWILISRGSTYRVTRRYQEALTDFSRAIEMNPDSLWILTSRGQLFESMERYEEALTDFNRAIELNPDSAWAQSRRGETYRLMERYDEALADFNRAIEIDPGSAWALGSRGQVFHSMERNEEALTDFNRAIELNPDSVWILISRGRLFDLMGRYEEALADFDRAIEHNPDSAWLLARRGGIYRLTGQYGEALSDYNRAIELNPDSAWALSRRGETYRLTGRYEEALADFDRAIELNPDSAWTLAARGQVYRLTGQYEEALADLTRALELDPSSGWYHISIALVWLCLANESKMAECLFIAEGLLENGDTTEDQGNRILCHVVRHNSSEARQLTSAFVELPLNRCRLKEFAIALADLAKCPGVDHILVDELVVLATSAGPQR